MIKVGDIVFQKRKGGIVNNRLLRRNLGLVIKEHREQGAIPQFCVQFNQNVPPKWYYQHDLYKITTATGGERN